MRAICACSATRNWMLHDASSSQWLVCFSCIYGSAQVNEDLYVRFCVCVFSPCHLHLCAWRHHCARYNEPKTYLFSMYLCVFPPIRVPLPTVRCNETTFFYHHPHRFTLFRSHPFLSFLVQLVNKPFDHTVVVSATNTVVVTLGNP